MSTLTPNTATKSHPPFAGTAATVQAFPEKKIQQFIGSAVSNVFKVMLNAEVTPTEVPAGAGQWPIVKTSPDGSQSQIVATIGFTGKAVGSAFIYLDMEFARCCTSRLLGMSEAELAEAGDEAVNDAIAEIANMTVGGFKNSLCDSGFPCMLTLPSVIWGSNFYVAPNHGAARYISHFDCWGHRIVAEIFLKIGD